MDNKARSFMGTLGIFNSLWTPIGILVIILFSFWTMQQSITALDKKQKDTAQIITKQLELLREISQSLKDKDRDHKEFSESQKNITTFMIENVRVMDRLAFTLDSIDKKLKE